MGDVLLLSAVIFGATFVQSLAGFGVALVGMPLLAWLFGVRVAAPLVALVGALLELAILLRYRASFDRRSTGRLILSSMAGIPVGVWAVGHVAEELILALLGAVLVAYAAYGLAVPRLPTLGHAAWAYSCGFVAGCLGGAYNTSGPPVVLYADLRGWPREQFKSNLQGFFLANSVLVVAAHAISGNLTPVVWRSYGWSLPAMLLGLVLGLALDRIVNPAPFRKLVLVLLFGLGVGLIL